MPYDPNCCAICTVLGVEGGGLQYIEFSLPPLPIPIPSKRPLFEKALLIMIFEDRFLNFPKFTNRGAKESTSTVLQTSLTLFQLRFRLFGPRAERPRNLIFGLFFQLWARRAQMTPAARSRKITSTALKGGNVTEIQHQTW